MRRDGKLLPVEGASAGEGDVLAPSESFTLGAVWRPDGGGEMGDARGSRLLLRRLLSGPGGMSWLGSAC